MAFAGECRVWEIGSGKAWVEFSGAVVGKRRPLPNVFLTGSRCLIPMVPPQAWMCGLLY